MIVLVGASASGKTEVAKYLKKHYDIKKVVTHTTRTPRTNEVDGIDYHFVTKTTFLKLKKDNFFVEVTEYNHNYYGTSKNEVADDKVLIVDPNGLASFLALKDPKIVTFYLKADDDIRLERMLSRGDDRGDALERIACDKDDFAFDKVKMCHYFIDSNKLNISEMAEEIINLYRNHLNS